MRIVGIDAALRHGAVVAVEISLDVTLGVDSPGPMLHLDSPPEVLFAWGKQKTRFNHQGIGLKDTPKTYNEFATLISTMALFAEPDRSPDLIAIDWWPGSVYMRTNLKQNVLHAFFMGQLNAQFGSYDITYVHPSTLRSKMGTPMKASKTDVLTAAKGFINNGHIIDWVAGENDDVDDSFILAVYAAMIKFGGEEAW